jgi:hypothetical protein
MSDKNKQLIINFALKELENAFASIKTGANPSVSKDFQNILNTLNAAEEQLRHGKITEAEMDDIVNGLVTAIEEKEEK